MAEELTSKQVAKMLESTTRVIVKRIDDLQEAGEERVDRITGKLNQIEERLERIETQILEDHAERLRTLERRLDKLTA